MFSRERGGSVSLYVDAEPTPKRISTQSMETVNLVPLHITPARRYDSLAGEISSGSGVSVGSSRYSRGGSVSLSTVQRDEGDLGVRPGRPRSTSTSSVRYYGRKGSGSISEGVVGTQLPPIPKIIRTESD